MATKSTYQMYDAEAESQLTWYGASHETTSYGYAAYAIYNRKGSGKIIRLKKAAVNQAYGLTSTTSCKNAAKLVRISAYTGGTDATSTSFFKLNSAHDALPAQIKLIKEPLTTTDVSTWRSFHVIPQYTIFRVGASYTSRIPGPRLLNSDCNSLLRPGYGCASCQRLVLDEDEGIAITQLGQRQSADYDIYVYFTDGTNSYIAKTYCAPMYTDCWFALWNGAGSGVALEIFDVQITDSGDTSEPIFDVTLISDMEEEKANCAEYPKALTALKFDSSTPTLSPYVLLYKNVFVTQVGGQICAHPVPASNQNWNYRRPMFAMPGASPTIVGTTANFSAGSAKALGELFSASSESPGSEIILREGYGIAFTKRRPGMGGRKEFSLTFTVENATATPDRAYPIIGGQHIIRTDHGR
jgi:hypothetical protein